MVVGKASRVDLNDSSFTSDQGGVCPPHPEGLQSPISRWIVQHTGGKQPSFLPDHFKERFQRPHSLVNLPAMLESAAAPATAAIPRVSHTEPQERDNGVTRGQDPQSGSIVTGSSSSGSRSQGSMVIGSRAFWEAVAKYPDTNTKPPLGSTSKPPIRKEKKKTKEKERQPIASSSKVPLELLPDVDDAGLLRPPKSKRKEKRTTLRISNVP
jgi:hypothetical protein